MNKMGKVYLVGAGPGDEGLLTVKAKAVIENAQVLVYDRLVSDAIMALAPKEAELIYVGKAAANHAMKQEEINQCLADLAKEGKVVVRLKAGTLMFSVVVVKKESSCLIKVFPLK